jgi:hypothetical protein
MWECGTNFRSLFQISSEATEVIYVKYKPPLAQSYHFSASESYFLQRPYSTNYREL